MTLSRTRCSNNHRLGVWLSMFFLFLVTGRCRRFCAIRSPEEGEDGEEHTGVRSAWPASSIHKIPLTSGCPHRSFCPQCVRWLELPPRAVTVSTLERCYAPRQQVRRAHPPSRFHVGMRLAQPAQADRLSLAPLDAVGSQRHHACSPNASLRVKAGVRAAAQSRSLKVAGGRRLWK